MISRRSIPLKRLATRITRGSAPTYAEEGDEAGPLVIGQSCQRPDGSVELSRARRHAPDAAVPLKGRVTGGEIVVNSTGTGTLGRVGLLPPKLPALSFVDTHVTVIDCDRKKVEPRFLARVLQLPNFRRLAEEALSVGATKQRELDGERLRAHQIALGSVDEQIKIADFLAHEADRIHAAQRGLARISLMAEEEGAAELEGLLYGDVEAHGDYWFGSAPDGYEVRPLGSLGLRGATSFFDGDWIEAPFLSEDGIRLLQTGNIGRGRFVGSSERYISDSTFEALNCSEVRLGDVLFSRLNLPMARACLAPELATRMIASVDVAILRPAPDIEAPWLVALASSQRWLGWLAQLARGTTMPRIARTTLSSIRIPVPPRDRQAEIANCFTQWATRIERVDALATACSTRLDEYRDALINEAVTGQLDISRVSEAQMDERAHAAMEGEPLEAVR